MSLIKSSFKLKIYRKNTRSSKFLFIFAIESSQCVYGKTCNKGVSWKSD